MNKKKRVVRIKHRKKREKMKQKMREMLASGKAS